MLLPDVFQGFSEVRKSTHPWVDDCHRTDNSHQTFINNEPVRAKTLNNRCSADVLIIESKIHVIYIVNDANFWWAEKKLYTYIYIYIYIYIYMILKFNFYGHFGNDNVLKLTSLHLIHDVNWWILRKYTTLFNPRWMLGERERNS